MAPQYKRALSMRLAPIGVVAEKLRSRSADVRAAALVHAQGHAANARALAAHVASMLDDVESVAWHAATTLGAIARGAADATSVLTAQLTRPGASDLLLTRALFGLKSIGPEAWAALPVLEQLYEADVRRSDVLAAMGAIAPNAPKVESRLADAVFSGSDSLSTVAALALPNSPGALDAAVAQLRLRAFSFSKAKRQSALRALPVLARLKPGPVVQLMIELSRGSKPKAALTRAVAVLPKPLPPPLEPYAPRPPRPSAPQLPPAATPPDPSPAAAPPPPAEPDYPDFPADEEPPAPGRLEPADDAPKHDAELAHGLQLIGRASSSPPEDLAQGLQTFFERQQGQPAPDDAAVQGLAAVWAHALVARYRWSWARWVRADERALVLASPNRAHMVFPAAWVRRQLRKREPTALAQFASVAHAAANGDEPTALW